MKLRLVLFAALITYSCGGSLSSEQRQKIRENMEAGSIKKVTDAELTEVAFSYARKIAGDIEKKSANKKTVLDSIAKATGTLIYLMHPDDATLKGVEKSLIDAYVADASATSLPDNLQRIGKDSLLYTKPRFRDRPDGSSEFVDVLAIRIPKKRVVMTIKSK